MCRGSACTPTRRRWGRWGRPKRRWISKTISWMDLSIDENAPIRDPLDPTQPQRCYLSCSASCNHLLMSSFFFFFFFWSLPTTPPIPFWEINLLVLQNSRRCKLWNGSSIGSVSFGQLDVSLCCKKCKTSTPPFFFNFFFCGCCFVQWGGWRRRRKKEKFWVRKMLYWRRSQQPTQRYIKETRKWTCEIFFLSFLCLY